MMNVQQKQVQVITFQPVQFGVSTPYNQPIVLQFKPDEVILRQISYSTNIDERGVIYAMWSNIFADQILFSFPGIGQGIAPNNIGGAFTQSMDVHFLNPNFKLSQIAQFRVLNGLDLSDTNLAEGIVSFTLEFIKYGPNVDIPNK